MHEKDVVMDIARVFVGLDYLDLNYQEKTIFSILKSAGYLILDSNQIVRLK